MKLAVIIPDRRDRPKFLANCMRMISNQTLKPEIVITVDYEPESSRVDITQRYRRGYDQLRDQGYDLIAFIENDDFYHPDYFKVMTDEWMKNKPNMIGTNYTYYYHICLRAYFKFNHHDRASAMNTFIVPDLNFEWCRDSEPYTDIHLWRVVKGLSRELFCPEKVISIGIKHGVGLCGGQSHTDRFYRLENSDVDFKFLNQHMDSASLKFYAFMYTMQDREELINSMSAEEREKIKKLPTQ